MASGVQVADVCITTFQELKLKKKLKYIIFSLSPDLSEVVVDKTSESSDYEAFIEDLPEGECRWAVYDFEFENKDRVKRSKIFLVLWSPDDAKIKDKMLFASSHEVLKHRLVGIAFEVQATDWSEIHHDTVLAKALTSTH